MSNRKSTSKLDALPPARQDEIGEHARAHTLEQTRAWLKEDGFSTSCAALSVWHSAWRLRSRFKEADADTLEFIQLLRAKRPDLPESELQRWGAEYFQMQAVKAGDSETFLAYASAREKSKLEWRKVEQRERQLQLDVEKWQTETAEKLLSAALRAKADEINASNISQAEKIAAMRAAAFADVEKLQKSGKLMIPKA